MNRREARGIALELLFEYDFNREKTPEEIILQAKDWREIKVNGFARRIFTLAAENISEIDRLISEKAQNWRLDRIGRLPKAIMRLCVAEIIYAGTPDRVAVNEAVELAKSYDDEKGVSFINGVLGGVVRSLPDYSGDEKQVAYDDDDGEAESVSDSAKDIETSTDNENL